MQWTSDLLTTLPNRERDPGIDTVDADDLSAERFKKEYVDRCRPCLIRGAVRHWPAFERWTDLGYLKEKIGASHLAQVRTSPDMELRWRETWGGIFAERAKHERATKSEKVMSASTFLDRASALEFIFCYANTVETGKPLGPLVGDLGRFPFDYGFPRPLGYEPRRAFFFGRSFTDWHTHFVDETLMCQVGAPKRVAMLPPTRETWEAMLEIARTRVQLGGPLEPFEAFRRLVPRVLVVEPGDATYIPPHWWHSVETLRDNRSFGATIAVCWGSPRHVVGDPRFYEFQMQFRRASMRQRTALVARSATNWLPEYLRGRGLPAIPSR